MIVQYRCDAWHDGHDCSRPGACAQALVAMCERIDARQGAADDHLDAERRDVRERAA